MPVIRAYVVDDERLAVQRLTRLLEETGRVKVAGSTTDSAEALGFLHANAVDVVFLDVQMPGLTGFELLEELDRDVPVVFTTAYTGSPLAPASERPCSRRGASRTSSPRTN